MRRFDSTRLGPRIAMMTASATLPLVAVILWLITGSIETAITTARSELGGNAFVAPLEHLLAAIPLRLIEVQTRGPDIGALDAEVDQAFVDLDRVADRYGAELQFTAEGLESRDSNRLRISLVRDRWRALTSEAPDRKSYDLITSDILAMIRYAANSSQLALDPDLDSSSLMDVVFRALPQMQVRLGGLMQEALELRRSKSPLAGGENRQAVGLGMLRTEGLERVERDLQVMLNEDANFYGVHVPLHLQVTQEWKQLKEAIESFVLLLENPKTSSSEELANAGKKAHSACRGLWTTSSSQLAELLEIRIRAYQAKRTRVLVLTSTLVLLAGFVGWRFGNRIEQQHREKTHPSQSAKEGTANPGVNWTVPFPRTERRAGFETAPPQ